MKIVKLLPIVSLCMLLWDCTNDEPIGVADPLYESVPSIANCTPGSLSEAEKLKILTYVNSVRRLHNLPDVEYDNLRDRLAQEAAMIGAASADISAAIVESDFCYLENAALECGRGNRSLWGSATAKWPASEIHVNDWMTELNSSNINDRRRILDPFLKNITFGRIIGTPKKGDFKYVSSAMLLTGGNADLGDAEIPYVAYPQGTYGAKLFDPNSILSFSVLHDKAVKSNNGASSVDFSEAAVEVSVGSQPMDIVEGSLACDYSNCGLPNNLQWKVQGLTKNVTYTVRIVGVKVAGETRNFEYTFSFK
ncbi:MAG: CAP domain-containing protein [Prevotellaceae bacterium]|jgi:hypothetical protein|nr:CAP domain-containing protein [Prevotellaceae bacterium]